MLDDVMDEEGAEENEEMESPTSVPAPEIVPDLIHTIGGVVIGFRRPKRGQLVALTRVRDHVSHQLFKVQRNTTLSDEERYRQASRLVMDIDVAVMNLVESLMINEEDKVFVANALLTGETDVNEISDVIFGNGPEAEDDAEPAAVVAAKKPARKAAARKVANAQRTTRK